MSHCMPIHAPKTSGRSWSFPSSSSAETVGWMAPFPMRNFLRRMEPRFQDIKSGWGHQGGWNNDVEDCVELQVVSQTDNCRMDGAPHLCWAYDINPGKVNDEYWRWVCPRGNGFFVESPIRTSRHYRDITPLWFLRWFRDSEWENSSLCRTTWQMYDTWCRANVDYRGLWFRLIPNQPMKYPILASNHK